MNGRQHEEQREELAAYLLGALSPDETELLELHVASCEKCREDLEWLRPAVKMLPEAVEQMQPPSELRERLMAEVRADVGRAPRTARRGRLRTFLLRPAAGLAAVALIVAGVVAYTVGDGGSGGGATTVASGEAPGVTAKIVREGDSGTLQLAHVHSIHTDEVLQAWVQRDEEVESAEELFRPHEDGSARTPLRDLDGVEAVMVSVEPRGGSEFPTSDPIVAVNLPRS